MRKRLNSTGRRKIAAAAIDLALLPETKPPAFTAVLKLDGLDLPGEAGVVVEAYRGTATERFAVGRVADLSGVIRRELMELEADPALQFRIKVVEPGTGKLLAARPRIRPGDVDDSGRIPLLSVREADLGPEPWRTEFDPVEGAVLVLNSAIPAARAQLQTVGRFQGSVLPAAFRQVLLRLWAEDVSREPDADAGDWRQRWLGFAEALAGSETPDAEDHAASAEWIDAACRGFAKRHPQFLSELEKEP